MTDKLEYDGDIHFDDMSQVRPTPLCGAEGWTKSTLVITDVNCPRCRILMLEDERERRLPFTYAYN
jgi:hypothetical protein